MSPTVRDLLLSDLYGLLESARHKAHQIKFRVTDDDHQRHRMSLLQGAIGTAQEIAGDLMAHWGTNVPEET